MEKQQTERVDLAQAELPVARKPYKKPVLEVYGDIGELTQSQGQRVRDGLYSSGPTAPIRPTPPRW